MLYQTELSPFSTEDRIRTDDLWGAACTGLRPVVVDRTEAHARGRSDRTHPGDFDEVRSARSSALFLNVSLAGVEPAVRSEGLEPSLVLRCDDCQTRCLRGVRRAHVECSMRD